MHRAVLWGFVCGLLLAAVTAPAVVASPAPATPQIAVAAQENNSTQHERPAAATGEGSEADVRRWLEGRLGGLLGESTIHLSQGEYEAADRLLGDEYEAELGKYVDVAGETDDADTPAERTLARAGDQQQTYVSLVQRYQATHESYEAARAAGDEARARELARRLQRLSENITATDATLTATLAAAGNTTNTDLSESIDRVEAVTANVTTQQEAVTAATFVATRLSLAPATDTASYTTPLRIEGRLTAADNATLPDAVVLRVAGTPRTVDLGANGSFTLAYRPTTLATGEQAIDVEYRPRNDSVFLGAQESVTTTIEAVTPTVAVAPVEDTVRYGDTLPVAGRVVVDGTPVEGVPVALRVGNHSLGTVVTGANGTFETTARVPAAVPAGPQSLTAAVAQEDKAIAGANGSTTVQVATASTAISVAAAEAAETVRLTGRLTAADGVPVAGQPVAIVRNGTQVATVTTNDTGHYAASLSRPQAAIDVRAVFDGAGTNLEAATATTRIEGLPATGRDSGQERVFPDASLPLLVGGLLAAGAAIALAGYAYRRRHTPRDPAPGPADTPATGTATEPSPEPPSPREEIAGLAAEAPSRAAVVDLYGVVRRALIARADDVAAQTHWEFYHAVAPDLGDDAPALRSLTEAYERVAYAEGAVSEDEWAEAVAAAEQLRDRGAFAGEAETGE